MNISNPQKEFINEKSDFLTEAERRRNDLSKIERDTKLANESLARLDNSLKQFESLKQKIEADLESAKQASQNLLALGFVESNSETHPSATQLHIEGIEAHLKIVNTTIESMRKDIEEIKFHIGMMKKDKPLIEDEVAFFEGLDIFWNEILISLPVNLKN